MKRSKSRWQIIDRVCYPALWWLARMVDNATYSMFNKDRPEDLLDARSQFGPEFDLPRYEDTEAGRRPRYYHGLPTRCLTETLELIRVMDNDLYHRIKDMSPKAGLQVAIRAYGLPDPDSTDNPLEVSGGVYEAVMAVSLETTKWRKENDQG